mmetsp:Transcript_57201/g.185887  ORF Transcript_57201/g.185887 Transcript_57201/m.185887 type:complete len:244 (+) Transcript_57201:1404-2135(+)
MRVRRVALAIAPIRHPGGGSSSAAAGCTTTLAEFPGRSRGIPPGAERWARRPDGSRAPKIKASDIGAVRAVQAISLVKLAETRRGWPALASRSAPCRGALVLIEHKERAQRPVLDDGDLFRRPKRWPPERAVVALVNEKRVRDLGSDVLAVPRPPMVAGYCAGVVILLLQVRIHKLGSCEIFNFSSARGRRWSTDVASSGRCTARFFGVGFFRTNIDERISHTDSRLQSSGRACCSRPVADGN